MSEEQRELIRKSKEFAERVLIDDVIDGSTEEYCIFAIGKFMLMKELVLQKNHKTKTIHFDIMQNVHVKNATLAIAQYVKEHNTQLITNIRGIDNGNNTLDIIIFPKEAETQELKEALWIVNKIRDSIAHGCYYIDFKNETIVIKNDSHISDGYSLVCEVPIRLLNDFFEENVSIAYVYNKYIHKEKTMFDLSISMLLNTPKISEMSPELKEIEEDSKNYILYSVQKLHQLFKYIQDSDSIDPIIKKQMILAIKECYKNELSPIKYSTVYNSNIKEILQKLFDELTIIMRKHSKSKSSISLIAMHNYLQNVFGFIHLDNPKIKNNLYLVDMTRFKINKMQNQTVLDISNSIKTETQRYIDTIETMILEFSHIGQINRIQNITTIYFQKIIELLNNRNYIILSSMRNGIEHAIISEDNNQITIRDMKDQTDREDENFSCTSDYEGLYSLSNRIESLERITEIELEAQKQDFLDSKIIEAIINAIGDQTLATKLFSCLNIVKTYIEKSKESTSVSELTQLYRQKKALELESLLLYRQSKIDEEETKKM